MLGDAQARTEAPASVWAVLRRYHRWVGDSSRASLPAAAAALVIEPVTFSLLLHAGAVLGWLAFLGGQTQRGSDGLPLRHVRW
ncbi:hypothetical protein MHPYR_760004 [uncultured Mycobacterium sp.]|uniref:Uncharacterized protein n=1 Tax=uncultured Mycobacterium sp. TaxID=171292 RepID=A0A1Y5PPP7_9MYCO|nr:hypothetical protein MHPYR_760004 [uncultured Mycobacterium sp.]